ATEPHPEARSFAIDALHGHADEQDARRRYRGARLPRRTDRRRAKAWVHFPQPRVHLERPCYGNAAHEGAGPAIQATPQG
ncbi:hypothetical protein BU632_11585, partial [Staphylococcus chromogenes]